MKKLKGVSASPGFASGTAVLHGVRRDHSLPSYGIGPDDVEEEYNRLHAALAMAIRDLARIRESVHSNIGEAEARIFDAHIALLNDQGFITKVKTRVHRELTNVEAALLAEIKVLSDRLLEVDNEYLRERAADIQDVGRRVLVHLKRKEEQSYAFPRDSVIVTDELFPSDTAGMDRAQVAAIVTERGGENTHAAILARSLGIPFVTAVSKATQIIEDGSPLLVDGEEGTVIVLPTAAERESFRSRKEVYIEDQSIAVAQETGTCSTRDGREIFLYGNISRVAETRKIRDHNLQGVGLLRTECLFLEGNHAPDAAIHERIYAEIAAALHGLPLTIRTLDLGGDKHPRFLWQAQDANPAMALRGLRYSLAQRTLFETQIAAVLRISVDHPVRVLLPMVADVEELIQAKKIIADISQSLGIEERLLIGAMIETPSAVFQAREIAGECDFLSIGTNDLAQFMLAADRQSASMMPVYYALHPVMLQAMRTVVHAASGMERPVFVCGEAAGDPLSACLLVGLGVRHLSMSPIRAARVRQVIRYADSSLLREMADHACSLKNAQDIRHLLGELDTTLQDRSGRPECRGNPMKPLETL